ncbi:hypothetical protein J2Z44_002986 [Clostridium punense]|uniref:DUF2004 domain-containing protein n=1 Tax=Clostridium punense TaxID=1054297 RepID=A0ABS4K7E1_9CLOT|nr:MULTISPECIES: hypothetical protein [Clostridium]EQB86544.1 hypothetical protein M918_13705 [Clostridium sp. BL8]MBP2023151.1 hypothetical protein [Clostridium punense]
MNKIKIFNMLEDNELYDLKEIKKNNDVLVVNFKYEFDDLEISGAESYANEEYDKEEKDDSWYDDYYLPYLNDMAIDNVEDIMDEICEEESLDYEFVAYELSKEQVDYVEFIAVFFKDEIDFELDELVY